MHVCGIKTTVNGSWTRLDEHKDKKEGEFATVVPPKLSFWQVQNDVIYMLYLAISLTHLGFYLVTTVWDRKSVV